MCSKLTQFAGASVMGGQTWAFSHTEEQTQRQSCQRRYDPVQNSTDSKTDFFSFKDRSCLTTFLLSLFMEAVAWRRRGSQSWAWVLPGVLDRFLQGLPHNVEWFHVSILPFTGELSAEWCIVLGCLFSHYVSEPVEIHEILLYIIPNYSNPVQKGPWWSLIWRGLTGVDWV